GGRPPAGAAGTHHDGDRHHHARAGAIPSAHALRSFGKPVPFVYFSRTAGRMDTGGCARAGLRHPGGVPGSVAAASPRGGPLRPLGRVSGGGPVGRRRRGGTGMNRFQLLIFLMVFAWGCGPHEDVTVEVQTEESSALKLGIAIDSDPAGM